MSGFYNRRQALALGLGGIAGLMGLAGCDTPTAILSPQSGPVKMRMFFWGSATREKLTKQAIDLYHQRRPDVTIETQLSDNSTYYGKLDAQIANKNVPDLIQLDMRYIANYVRKGTLLDMTQLIYNQTIELTDFDSALLASAKANNSVYGIPLGSNYQCMLYNQVLLNKAKVGAMPLSANWGTFAEYSSELTKALNNGIYGTADNSGSIESFEVWIRQRNKELYTRDGNLSFDLEDAGEWYNYWNNLRKTAGCPPMTVQVNLDVSGSPTDSSVVKGQTVHGPLWSNQFEAFQAASTNPLGLTAFPNGTTKGMYLKTALMLGISATSKYPNVAAEFISFMINDVNAVKVLGLERGIPGSAKGLAVLTAGLSPNQKVIMNYMEQVRNKYTRPKEVLDPPGAGKVADLLRKYSQEIGLGHTTVSDGAKEFYTQAKKIVTPA
jgi:multiple sugar transport system substrate-binding protein